MSESRSELKIRLHSYDAAGDCQADIVLPDSGIEVQSLKVKKSNGGGIQVYMPNWMHTRWGYTEISWAEVRQQVTECYRMTPAPRSDEAFRTAFLHFSEDADRQIDVTLQSPVFRFYNFIERMECGADVTVGENALVIRELYVTCEGENAVRVYMPRYMRGVWAYGQINWEMLQAQVAEQFRAQILNGAEPEAGQFLVNFRDVNHVKLCTADAALPEKRSVMKGFRLKDMGNGIIRVSPPGWMNGFWKDRNISWNQLTELIRAAYRDWQNPEKKQTPEDASGQEPVTGTPVEDAAVEMPAEQPATAKKQPTEPRATNEQGRVENAKSCDFRFVPQTVLRPEQMEEQDKRYNTDAVVRALVKGPNGGIGPLEIKIVSWVDKMRYLTSAMLADLLRGGYISRGWREKVTKNKLGIVIKRLRKLGLIEWSRFVAVDDNGVATGNKGSVTRVLTLNKTGATMLHDMGIGTSGYRPFDIFQDGNTVKRYLAANQWLIYWMIHFPREIGDSYEVARVVYQRSSDMQGARMYATVTCNDQTLVAEPVRRVEDFEQKDDRIWLRGKLSRFLEMFDHLDELYTGREELVFPDRPVLVYICEDDDHIHEVLDTMGDMLEGHPEQEIWFTTDLRIFNYDMMGQRFLKVSEKELTVVDLSERLGIQECREDTLE